jgi:hypothetical protein
MNFFPSNHSLGPTAGQSRLTLRGLRCEHRGRPTLYVRRQFQPFTKLKSILIDPGPSPRSYDSVSKALEAEPALPGQSEAQSTTNLFKGSTITRGNWTSNRCEISFSNGYLLSIEAQGFQLSWETRETSKNPEFSFYEPVEIVWNPEVKCVFDPNLLLERISEARLQNIRINDFGLLLYTQNNPILWFHAVQAQNTGKDYFGEFGE